MIAASDGVEGEVRLPDRVDDERVHERAAPLQHHEGHHYVKRSQSWIIF